MTGGSTKGRAAASNRCVRYMSCCRIAITSARHARRTTDMRTKEHSCRFVFRLVPQLPEDAKPPRAANLRVYPLAIREGIVYVWMGDDPWGEGAKDILPVPCTEDDLDKNQVRTFGSIE